MAKRGRQTGLGRGLAALLPVNIESEKVVEERSDPELRAGMTAWIELKKIRPNPYQPRGEFDREALEDLKRSIREKGVIQPITVRKREGGYELVSGERRVRASIELGLERIPAYIISVDDDSEMLELALIENIQRENLNPVEIALGYRYLIEERGLTQEEVAKKVGKDRATVANFLRLLKLPSAILEALRIRKISMGHARALLALPEESQQIEVYERIVREELSVRKTEKLVRQLLQKRSAEVIDEPPSQRRKQSAKVAEEISIAAQEIEDRLRQVLGTQVRIRLKDQERGSIEITFYSSDELHRLLELFAIIEKSGWYG